MIDGSRYVSFPIKVAYSITLGHLVSFGPVIGSMNRLMKIFSFGSTRVSREQKLAEREQKLTEREKKLSDEEQKLTERNLTLTRREAKIDSEIDEKVNAKVEPLEQRLIDKEKKLDSIVEEKFTLLKSTLAQEQTALVNDKIEVAKDKEGLSVKRKSLDLRVKELKEYESSLATRHSSLAERESLLAKGKEELKTFQGLTGKLGSILAFPSPVLLIQHVSHSDARYIGYKHKLKAGGYSLVKLVQYSNFNRKLAYEVKKAEMTIKGYATEYLLYHGTRKTDPRIVAENGLDIQYASTKSSLGPAIYGSVDINYCHAGKYSHRYYDRGLRRNLNVLIVYRCLTGRVLKIKQITRLVSECKQW